MNFKNLISTAFYTPLGLCALVATPNWADAHGFAGERFFPATISTDDPFVADELSLPTFQAIRQSGAPPTKTFDFSSDIALKLTPSLGIQAGEGYMLQKSHGSRLRTGFDNVVVGGKYQFLLNAEHEMIVSVGVDAVIGGTGRASIGADRFSTITPGLFLAKVSATCRTRHGRSGHSPSLGRLACRFQPAQVPPAHQYLTTSGGGSRLSTV